MGSPRGIFSHLLRLLFTGHSSLSLETFQHPHVGVGDATQYGEVAAVRRRYTPNGAALRLVLPQHAGVPLQIHVEEGAALRRNRAAVKPFSIRGPVKTGEVRPTFHCDFAVGATRE